LCVVRWLTVKRADADLTLWVNPQGERQRQGFFWNVVAARKPKAGRKIAAAALRS